VNRNVVIFLGLAAVVAVGLVSALTGLGGSAVNRWTLMGAVLVVFLIARAIEGIARRGNRSAPGGPAEREP
jgi:hypothetical protein